MRIVALLLLAGCWSESKPKAAEPKPAEPKKVIVEDVVQPMTIEKVDPPHDDTPPPPPPSPTMNVAPQMLEGSRIAGDKAIVPDDVDKVAIQQSGKDKLVGSFKLCLDTTGVVSNVVMLKSTGI